MNTRIYTFPSKPHIDSDTESVFLTQDSRNLIMSGDLCFLHRESGKYWGEFYRHKVPTERKNYDDLENHGRLALELSQLGFVSFFWSDDTTGEEMKGACPEDVLDWLEPFDNVLIHYKEMETAREITEFIKIKNEFQQFGMYNLQARLENINHV